MNPFERMPTDSNIRLVLEHATKAKILLVEDEYLVGKDIQNMLSHLGYDVTAVVPTGEEAVAAVQSNLPHLVLMDIVLKGELDGILAAKMIKENNSIPIVFLTAYADEATLSKAKTADPHGYLLKPFEERELQTAIELALFNHEKEKNLAYSFLHDRVTELPNKWLFMDHLFKALQLAKRRKDKAAVLLVKLTLPPEKEPSDSPDSRDAFIKHIGSHLSLILRKSDSIARLESGEFLLLLQEISQSGLLNSAVQRIREEFQKALAAAYHKLPAAGIVIGASLFPDDGEDVDSLVQRAAAALARAKRQQQPFLRYDQTMLDDDPGISF